MAIDIQALQAAVLADVPWQSARPVAGTLRFQGDSLVVDPRGAGEPRIAIPVGTIARASVESTLGVLPALHVWHTVRDSEQESRFAFSAETDRDGSAADDMGPALSDRIGPGVARDAAQALESGFRVLTGGISRGRRTARQAVEGLARQEEYRQWPAAIAQLQRQARTSKPDGAGTGAPSDPPRAIVPPDVRPPAGSAAAQLAWFRETVPAWLSACSGLAGKLGVHGVPVIQPMYPLDSPICRIVVVGEFSRGKSTLINALFGIHGEIALPTGMTPTTPIACALRVPRVGERDGATITYRTRRAPLELTLEQFRGAVRVADDATPAAGDEAPPDPHLHEARRVEVRVTGAYLPSGVEIEDTPGLNEQSGRSAGALAALGRADLILFVLAADQLLGDLERETIFGPLVNEYHRNALFLINFWDTIVEEGERENLRTRARAILADFPSPFRGADEGARTDTFYVSALQAARAQRQRKAAPDESGIPLLRARLRELLGPEAESMLLRARAGRARRFVRILRDAVSRAVAERGAAERRSAPAGKLAEAVAAAKRSAAGLPDAAVGATARLQAGLEQGTVGGLGALTERLEAQRIAAPSQGDEQLRRSLLAALRAVAADYTRAAQEALDLVAARARAAFMERGLEPPSFDLHVNPLSFAVPAGAESAELLALARSAPRELRADLEWQTAAIAEELARICDERSGAAHADEAEATSVAEEAATRIAALRQLEDDLVRLDRLLAAML